MKSAIDWGLVTKAKRAQEKLSRYFELLEEVRSLEADPDVAAFLSSEAPSAPKPAQEGAAPTPAATASPAATPIRLESRIIQRALRDLDSEDFDAQDLAPRIAAIGPDYVGIAVKQVNDHLRRLAKAGQLERTEEGRRGRRGSLPRYRLIASKAEALK